MYMYHIYTVDLTRVFPTLSITQHTIKMLNPLNQHSPRDYLFDLSIRNYQYVFILGPFLL